jgi:hypothetical protein
LREENRLRAFCRRVPRKMFGIKRKGGSEGGGRKEQETGGNCIVRSFMICNPHQILLGWSYQDE